MKKKKLLLLIPVLLLLAGALGIGLYLQDYYRAEPAAAAAMQTTDAVTVTQLDRAILFEPENPSAGLLFYPGGKVECIAYAPLMRALAEKGFFCILLPMPGNLAVLDPNAASGWTDQYPAIGRWFIGGHSLGGAMAAGYAAKHADELDGLILLAAYSTADLTDSGLSVLSVYGSEDGVMRAETYEKYRANLPADARETVLAGGCHACFGCYGAQEGDGIPQLTNAEQIAQTADLCAALLP